MENQGDLDVSMTREPSNWALQAEDQFGRSAPSLARR